MSWHRLSLVAVAVLVAVAALVAVGRSERSRETNRELRGIRAVAAAIGPLDNRTLSAFRVLPSFDCLLYRRGANVFALEVCVDGAGRVVEAIDRRGETRRFWSLRFEPSASTLRVDHAEVERLLRRMRES